MGRIKRDHSGWQTMGIFKKYQQPSIVERNLIKSKKNTVKWCGGKIGKEHQLIRYFDRPYLYLGGNLKKIKYIKCECQICKKQFYRKKDSSIPLIIDLNNKYEYSITYQIQVKVNGKAIPFPNKEALLFD